MSRSRKPPVMTGPFAQAADDFIQYKRSCGFKYEYEPKCLSRFCRFATDKGVTSVEISRELAEAWIAPRDGESVLAMRPTFFRNNMEPIHAHLCRISLPMNRSML